MENNLDNTSVKQDTSHVGSSTKNNEETNKVMNIVSSLNKKLQENEQNNINDTSPEPVQTEEIKNQHTKKSTQSNEKLFQNCFNEWSKAQKNWHNLLETSKTSLNNEYEKYNSEWKKKITETYKNETLNSKELKAITKKINIIISVHSNLYSSISEALSLLHKFLGQPDIWQTSNPWQEFINGNLDVLLKSWVFTKLDFNMLDYKEVLRNDKIPEYIKNFISDDIKGKLKKLRICNSDEWSQEKDFIKENIKNLKKISFENLKNDDFYTLFPKEEVGDNNSNNKNQLNWSRTTSGAANRTKSLNDSTCIEEAPLILTDSQFLQLKTIRMNKCNFTSVSFNTQFPNIEKLVIKDTCFSIGTKGNSYFPNLKILIIEKSDITNQILDNIMGYLLNNSWTLKNLEELSFANNKITKVAFANLQKNNFFESLIELNFSNNKIYKFAVENWAALPNLHVLNLSSNNFAFDENYVSLKSHKKNTLFLFAQNLFVMKEFCRAAYCQYLNNNLQKFEYKLKAITFEGLYTIFNKHLLGSLTLNEQIQSNWVELNLAYCSLNNSEVVEFIKKNANLSNLCSLSIDSNWIDDEFFSLYLKGGCNKIWGKIGKINFSGTSISGFKEITSLWEFWKVSRSLKKVNFMRTPFEENLFHYFRYKYRSGPQDQEQDSYSKNINMKSLEDNKSSFLLLEDIFEGLEAGKSKIEMKFRDWISKQTREKIKPKCEMLFKYIKLVRKSYEK